ncbi:MAG: GNAT family N-acetyltransferase [Flavobacteriales bacterium]|nr:GNAT family N-acetyltransferase [Flavobacteriales bacterium]
MTIPSITYRRTKAADFDKCVEVRGKTRQNPASAEYLATIGITAETQAPLFEDGTLVGFVAESNNEIVGFCTGIMTTGEVQVLAMLPEFEGLGIGKTLLQKVVDILFESGFDKLWLAASPDPEIRAYGFYRHLGWKFSGKTDDIDDQILELRRGVNAISD